MPTNGNSIPASTPKVILALRQSRAGEHNVLRFYASYLRGAVHGDLGTSHALGQPVRSLLRERWPVTLRVAGIGLLLAWTLSLNARLYRLPLAPSSFRNFRHHDKRRVSLYPRRCSRPALRNSQRSRIPRHRADRVPQDLSLFAQPLHEGLRHASHHRRSRPRPQ